MAEDKEVVQPAIHQAKAEIIKQLEGYKNHLEKGSFSSFFEFKEMFEEHFEEQMIIFAENIYNTGLYDATTIAEDKKAQILDLQIKD